MKRNQLELFQDDRRERLPEHLRRKGIVGIQKVRTQLAIEAEAEPSYLTQPSSSARQQSA
ncbi:MAG: hypothetical protein ACYDHP_06430 [Ferrimicrobium sp.]